MGAELEIRLQGPGWYWVDETGSSLRVVEQVPFELELALRGHFQMAIESGVLSLGFRPSAEPFVRLQSPTELAVRSVNAWGALLRVVPGASPQRRAAERFHREASDALRSRLRAGASFTYVLSAGQADATLGQLPPGETPRRPFGEPNWVVNERLLLGPGAVQVLGPIDPGAKQLNVIVERGSGVGYRAICDSALRDHFRAIQRGQVAALPGAVWSSGGNVSGSGEHTLPLVVRGCPYFLVTWSLKEDYTLADILVRS